MLGVFCYRHFLKTSISKALYLLTHANFLSAEFRVLVRDMKMTYGSFLISGQSCTRDLMWNLKLDSWKLSTYCKSIEGENMLTLRKTWCWRFGWGVFFHCASIKRKLVFFHCVNVEHDFSIFEIVFHILVFCKWKKKMYEIKKGIPN